MSLKLMSPQLLFTSTVMKLYSHIHHLQMLCRPSFEDQGQEAKNQAEFISCHRLCNLQMEICLNKILLSCI